LTQIITDWSVIRFKENKNADEWHFFKSIEIFFYTIVIAWLFNYTCDCSNWKILLYVLIYLSIRLSFFDIGLNLMRGLKWNHIGNSITDKLTRDWWYVSKIIGICALAIFMFLYFHWWFVELFLNL